MTSPPKRPRFSKPFTIRNLLDLPPSPPSQIGGGNRSAEDYIEQLEGSKKFNKKFRMLQWDSRLLIKDLPADPEELLAGIFQASVDASLEESERNGIKPDHLGAIITSTLLDPDIYIPIRPITDNTVDMILNMFLKVAQSKRQDDITLWGEPFIIKITTLSRNQLPSERQIRGGAYTKRKLGPIHHNIRKNAIIKIKNEDRYCLFMALQATMTHHVRFNDDQFYDYLNGRYGYRGKLKMETRHMMEDIGAPLGLKEYDARIYVPMVINHWNNNAFVGQYRFKVFIFGAMGHYKPLYKYGPDDFDIPIILYFNNNHFDGIRTTHGMFNKAYCLSCQMVYHTQKDHQMICRSRCRKCARCGPTYPCQSIPGYTKKCQECKKVFTNDDCYRHHLKNGYCNESKQCDLCGVIWNVKNNCQNGRKGHVCNERYCSRCRDYHDPERGCFIKPLQSMRSKKSYRLIIFDMESMQYQPADPSQPNQKRKHEVNFIAAKITCPDCIDCGRWKENLANPIDECEICGPNRTVTFGHRDFSETEVDFHHVTENPIVDFVNWILYELPIEYDTYAYAHNGGRFDFMFICKQLYLQKLNPTMTRKGNKLFEMKVEARKDLNPNIIFRDSFNLINLPLATLVPAFELDVCDKPFYPYLANNPSNYGVRMLKLPPKEDYLYKGFMPAKRKIFDEWYEQHQNEAFFLDESLPAYTINDCEILLAALVKFRAEFIEISKRPPDANGNADRAASTLPHDGIDPLRECLTIAAACMRHFRMNHLKKDHLALISDRGYDTADNQSLLALKFMQWYAEKENVTIQMAHSKGGEKNVGRFKLDGWIEERQTGIEVNGCTWHSCPKCFPDDNLLMPTGRTAGMQREKDRVRMDFILSKVPRVEVFWECEIQQMLEKDKEMKKKFDEYLDEGPLNIRDCFYGGRTGPQKLYHEAKPGEKISYVDVTSLYPFTNFMLPEAEMPGYPVGIPKMHILNKEVNWTRPEDLPYPLAIIKAFVIPPKNIDIPVLPMKLDKDERLLFPLCATCARQNPHGGVMENYSCHHNDQQRGWVANCTSVETMEALKQGYRFIKIYRVLEYLEQDDELFRPYMREFLAQKFHASGFDDSIKGNKEAEDKFIRESAEKFGITIDRSKMMLNKGKRLLAKLCVNNLWGRFSLRNYGLSQSYITDDPAELGQFLDDRSIEVTTIDELTDETIMISYLQKKDWIDPHECANVVISLWTTSCARLHLLKLMQKIARTPGCTLIYVDTDSVLYSHPEGKDVLKTGPHLGQLTDEYPNHRILEVVSGGAKQYGLKLHRIGAPEGEFEYSLKIRGITLNHDVMENQGLRYETFKASVLNFAQSGEPTPISVLYPNFLRPSIKEGIVFSQPLRKIYKPFVAKGIVRPSDFRVLDFGYIPINSI